MADPLSTPLFFGECSGLTNTLSSSTPLTRRPFPLSVWTSLCMPLSILRSPSPAEGPLCSAVNRYRLPVWIDAMACGEATSRSNECDLNGVRVSGFQATSRERVARDAGCLGYRGEMGIE